MKNPIPVISSDYATKWQYVELVRSHIKELTPASMRLLKAIFEAKAEVNRAAIMARLNRRVAAPHDVNLLRDLVKRGFIQERKQRRPLTDSGHPTGYEYVYSMPKCIRVALRSLKGSKTPAPIIPPIRPRM